MICIEYLPQDILRKIQDYLEYKDQFRSPFCCIDTIKFPFRYPIQSFDINSFYKWIVYRKNILSDCVTTLMISNHNFLHHDKFLKILEILFSFPNVRSISLCNFRPNYLLFDAIPIRFTLLLLQKLYSIKNSLLTLNVSVPFLLHVNPSIRLDTLRIGFGSTHYSSSNFSRSYSANTGTYPLRILLERMKKSDGYIKNLMIGTSFEMDKIFDIFSFLFTPDLYKIVGSIHIQRYSYVRDPVLMTWTQNHVHYSVATEKDISEINGKK